MSRTEIELFWMTGREESSINGNSRETDVRRLPIGPVWSPKVDRYTHANTHTHIFFEGEQERNEKTCTENLTAVFSR